MALTAVQVKNAKPREMTYKLADERGPYSVDIDYFYHMQIISR